jgi:hypothetical protein
MMFSSVMVLFKKPVKPLKLTVEVAAVSELYQALSEADRLAFVARNTRTLWAAIDTLTQP